MNRMALGISNLPSSSNFQKEMCHFNHVLQPQLWASRTETSLESFDQTMSMREGHQVYEDIDEAHQEMMRLWRPKRW
ncbi:uncharacterized protein BROUX77_001954 [Berkeleyomyces rouxiae]|uniref:uncharacterized protein n=1 Tax=Berkeleyomyces rouxiae TaxID=2035830 RepID=UPI003B8260A6